MSVSTQTLFDIHLATLNEAVVAVHSRSFYARFPEPPSGKIYGETAPESGLSAWNNQLGKRYRMIQTADTEIAAGEVSPYTLEPLNIRYPAYKDVETYISKSGKAYSTWRKTDFGQRAGILIESLERIKARFFELAHATMHTTGQSFVMSFQASGPHAADRALEAIALAYHELTRFPASVTWTKPMGKFDVTLRKEFRMVPKGISLAIGCSTFPVWNTVPGIYASLMTGNSVIVKPHPKVIYPIALVVDELQKVLLEAGMDPNTILLAPDTEQAPITRQLAEHPQVKIIDFTGSGSFGNYIEQLPGKTSFTEKTGINCVVLESCADLKGMMDNLAFSVSLYSGQMCTAPQNFFVPKNGIMVNGTHLSYDDTVLAFADAISGLVNNEKVGPGTLGAIQAEATAERVKEAGNMGLRVVRESTPITNPEFPNARMATPLLLEVSPEKLDVLSREMFGPIAFVIPVDSWEHGVELARNLAIQYGALSFAAYTTSEQIQDQITDRMEDTFTMLSYNFTGPIWVNQSAGFSDFHVSGGNPAGNASLTDPEFVTRRFEIVGIRIKG